MLKIVFAVACDGRRKTDSHPPVRLSRGDSVQLKQVGDQRVVQVKTRSATTAVGKSAPSSRDRRMRRKRGVWEPLISFSPAPGIPPSTTLPAVDRKEVS